MKDAAASLEVKQNEIEDLKNQMKSDNDALKTQIEDLKQNLDQTETSLKAEIDWLKDQLEKTEKDKERYNSRR